MAGIERFSRRHGVTPPRKGPPILQAAPERLRVGILSLITDEMERKPSFIRSAICDVRKLRANSRQNWSEYPNIWDEAEELVHDAEWFEFYDFVEKCADWFAETGQLNQFETATNALLEEENIGWRLKDGFLEFHGDEPLEDVMEAAHEDLEASEFEVAFQELQEARRDLSRRPAPDLSGAIHHAMAALESVTRVVAGEPKKTLGDIIKRNPGLLPPPVDDAAAKLWGFASEQGRHGSEGRNLEWAETMLVVGTAAALCSYLIAKQKDM